MAKITVITPFAYNKLFGSLDPENRYYFETHASVVVGLDGLMARAHEITMKFLGERVVLPS